MHLAGTAAAADKSIDPSARKKRGPQDDNAKVYPVSSAASSPASPSRPPMLVILTKRGRRRSQRLPRKDLCIWLAPRPLPTNP
jgi:hypothetical protein